MLRLRPHHLIDIIRNIGQGRPVAPHPYGHDQHSITQKIMDGMVQEIQLVVGADDLCKPCMHLTGEGLCDDILPQLEFPVSKQQYNDDLDQRLLKLTGREKDSIITFAEFLDLLESRIEELLPLCTHPGEDEGKRRSGIERGLRILRGSLPGTLHQDSL